MSEAEQQKVECIRIEVKTVTAEVKRANGNIKKIIEIVLRPKDNT